MASYITTNYSSLQAQNNLSMSSNKLQTSIERLSSGLRINTAADDPAGLAISDRMSAQISGLNQAGLNANNGISLAQTADGALASVSSDLQSIRQLAVESANSTNSSSDRQSLNQQSQQLLAAIQQIATSTQFNGTNLLDGSFQSQEFQVGANAGETIGVSLQGATTGALGAYQAQGLQMSTVTGGTPAIGGASVTAADQGTATSSAFTATDNILINGIQVGASIGTDPTHGLTNSSATAKAAAINAVSAQTGVTATATTSFTGTAAPTLTTPAGGGTAVSTALSAGDLYINNVQVGAVASATTAQGAAANFVAAINAVSAQSGVSATANSATGAITLSAADGRDITLGTSTAAQTNIASYFGATDLGTNGSDISTVTPASGNTAVSSTGGLAFQGTLALSSSSTFALEDGAATNNGGTPNEGLAAAGLTATAGTGTGLVTQTQSTLASVDLTTAANATSALSVIDAAINQVDSQRATLGAISNRFQVTVTNLSQDSANLSQSRSRIQDTDYAAETANLSQAQILQQAGTAMLTQANSLPNSVLSLLKGQ